jgi:hypothetical protein
MKRSNPILALLCDSNGTFKEEITTSDLERFQEKWVLPYRKSLALINDYQSQNPNPSRADSRNNLVHLLDQHRGGYIPLGDLAFLSDEECLLLEVPIIHHAYVYLSDLAEKADTKKIDVFSCTRDGHFLAMALLYEVLPIVGKRLRGEVKSRDELRSEVEKIFETFQRGVAVFNNLLSHDTGIFSLSCMNLKVFGSATGTASDGTAFFPTFKFGPKNDGEDLNAVQLLEGVFRAIINEIPAQRDTLKTTPDNLISYIRYGGSSDLSSAQKKIDLFVTGVEATALVRSIVALQHQAMYSGDDFSQEVARRSNEFFTLENFLSSPTR